jgi:hypothetical protein
LREGTALPLPTQPSTNYARTLKKIVLIIQVVIKMRSPQTHQTGKHLKISLSDKYIHEANRYIQNDLINKTAIYTPRNDSVAVCSICHSFGACYGEFYTFYLPSVKSIPFANVYNFTSNNVFQLALLFAPLHSWEVVEGAPWVCTIV